MVALKQIMLRTGLDETEAKKYLQLAEDRVRLYLAYQDDEDVSAFASVIADVGSLLYERQQAMQTAQQAWMQTAGMSSKSYSEGPVSVHETYANYEGGASAAVSASYETQINQSLQSIARYRRVRVVKC